MLFKIVSFILIFSFIGAPAFSETICIEETELQTIIEEHVDAAIDEAVSIVIKEKDLKYNNLYIQYRLVENDNKAKTAQNNTLTAEIKLLKHESFWNVVKAIGITFLASFVAGAVTGIAITN